jgi:predicted dehydrogenase
MSRPEAPLRVGIVGCGAMAEYHVNRFSRVPGVTVAACSDRSEERARAFAGRLGIPRWFGSAGDMAGSGEVDCMSTAVVPAAHAQCAMEALRRGLPLFAEKPLARTLPEAEDLLAAARASGIPACVNFSKRNAPALWLARSLVKEGRIGRITGASFSYLQSWLLQDSWGAWERTPRWRWRASRLQSADGIVGDLHSHIIDAVRFILGEIESVSTLITCLEHDPECPERPGAPETCSSLFCLPSGTSVATRSSWRAAGQLDSFAFQVEGDAGSIAVDLAASRDEVKLFELSAGSWVELKAPPVPSTYEQFVSAVRGGSMDGPGFEDGVAVQRVIEACSVSAREGRAVAPGAAATA